MSVMTLEKATRAAGLRILALAAVSPSVRIRALLEPHKVALRAIEQQAALAMQVAMDGATTVVEQFRASKLNIRAAHIVASKLAKQHAEAEFRLLGLEPPRFKMPSSTGYANQLSRDLNLAIRNPNLSVRDKRNRAVIAVTSAVNRAYTDTQLLMYAGVAASDPTVHVEKIWVTNGPNPCDDCRARNGMVMPVAQEFPYTGTVYADLQGPPRHPYCHCRLVVRARRVTPASPQAAPAG